MFCTYIYIHIDRIEGIWYIADAMLTPSSRQVGSVFARLFSLQAGL